MKQTGVFIAMVLCAVTVVLAQDSGLPTLTGFSVPEYDKDGTITSQLFGDFAEFLPDGIIRITNLRIDSYEDGEVAMRVTAPYCIYNEREKTAESESSVRIGRENMVVTGVGFVWNSASERLEIRSRAKVVLKNVKSGIESGESS